MNRLVLFIFLVTCLKSFCNETLTHLNKRKLKKNRDSLENRQNLGMNNSPTPYTLSEGKSTVGPYVLVYGMTDQLSLGTSTWLYWDYNTANIFLRYGGFSFGDYDFSIQSVYMKSFYQTKTSIINGYQWESLRNHLTISPKKNNEYLKYHINIGYEYFFDETFSHSFRREPLNNDPYQLSLTSLFEVELKRNDIIQIEAGLLGLNYTYPQFLFGLSSGRRYGSLYIQLGGSINITPYALMTGEKRNSKANYRELDQEDMRRDVSFHPELQLQYYF